MAAGAQQPAPPPQQPSAAEPGVVKFSTSLNLVVETITVNDTNAPSLTVPSGGNLGCNGRSTRIDAVPYRAA